MNDKEYTYPERLHGKNEKGALNYHHVRIHLAGPNPNELASDDSLTIVANIIFQNGPMGEVGVNGIFMEDLIDVLTKRLEDYQETDYKCRENALAITKLQEAKHWLLHRTAERVERGVEGTSEV